MPDNTIKITNTSILKEKVRLGADARRRLCLLSEAELGYTTDTKRLFAGDGSTLGGNPMAPEVFPSVTSISSGLVRNDILDGDIFIFGDSDGLNKTLKGPYLKNGNTAVWMGPDFNPEYFEVSDGMVSLTSRSSFVNVQTGFLLPLANTVALDGAFWTINNSSGQLTFGFGTGTETDFDMSVVIRDSKTKKAGIIVRESGVSFSSVGGPNNAVVLSNTASTNQNHRVFETVGSTGSLRFAFNGNVLNGDDSYYGFRYNDGISSGISCVKSVYNSGVRTDTPLYNIDYSSERNGVIAAFGAPFNPANPSNIQFNTSGSFTSLNVDTLTVTFGLALLNNILPSGNGVLKRDAGSYSMIDTTNLVLDPGFITISAHPILPSGWLYCNGAAVSRTLNSALFAKIGTTHGIGDGSTTFNLPNIPNIGDNIRYVIKT